MDLDAKLTEDLEARLRRAELKALESDMDSKKRLSLLEESMSSLVRRWEGVEDLIASEARKASEAEVSLQCQKLAAMVQSRVQAIEARLLHGHERAAGLAPAEIQ